VGITVCTGWHPAGYKEYARYFVETFHQYWPASINLIAYTEEPAPMPRGECRSLWGIPGAREFYERHRHNPVHCGKAPHPRMATEGHSPRSIVALGCRAVLQTIGYSARRLPGPA
jgi:hypothetical protein